MSAHRYRGVGQGRVQTRVQQRASQRAALDRPDLTQHYSAHDLDAGPALPAMTDGPVIPLTHPTWWLVHRVIQVRPGLLDFELIAECRTELEAIKVTTSQRHQCRITKWRDKQQPYFSFRPVKSLDSNDQP